MSAMIAVLCLAVMGAVVYAMLREGLFNALCHLFGVIFSGMIAVHMWPWFGNVLEASFDGSFLAHYEDGVALLGVFCVVLLMCRVVTNLIANRELDIPPQISQIGGGVVGAVTGYILAGFLVFALQTLPWDEKFLGYQTPETEEKVHYITNKVFPPDQIWLKMMKWANERIFEDEDRAANLQDPLFSDFTYKYAKYRRLQPDGKPFPIPEPPPPEPEKKDPPKKEPEKKDPPKKEPEKKDPPKKEGPDPTPDLIPDPPKKDDPM